MTRYCNRCNERKESNGPCPKCGCSEFRIVEEEGK
jgi:Zn finger protein HypA/HybF involved in hydrogenase expression